MKAKTQYVIISVNIVVTPILVLLIALAIRSFTEKKMDAYITGAATEAKKTLKEGGALPVSELDRLQRKLNFKAIMIAPNQSVVYSSVPDIRVGIGISEVFSSLHKKANSGYQYMLVTDERNNDPDFKDFTVIIQTEKKSGFYAFTNTPFDYFIISMIAIMIISIQVTISTIRKITTAITRLDEATKNVSLPDLDQPVKIEGSDEIKSLVHSFNAMRSTIKRTVVKRNNFVMGISHDFKTPLALIKGYAEILEGSLPDVTEEQEEYLSSIGLKVEQLESMLDDLMEFLAIDATGPSQSQDSVDFGVWMKKYVERCGSDAALLGKKIESDITIPPNTVIRMDERLIERAFDNLVHNSFRYTDSRGIVKIEAVSSGRSIVVRFTDNGSGIDEKDLPFIFDMFYRGTPSRQTQGMGLGLSVVKNIIDSHEWRVSVASTPGNGSTFEITIPKGPAQPPTLLKS